MFLPKSFNPKNGQKLPKGRVQRKYLVEGTVAEMISERHPRVLTWNPPLELDGAPSQWTLPLGTSKKAKSTMWLMPWNILYSFLKTWLT